MHRKWPKWFVAGFWYCKWVGGGFVREKEGGYAVKKR